MINNLFDPLILFFILGLVAGVLKSGLKVPESLYDALIIYLLLAIGLKGGIQLAEAHETGLSLPYLSPFILGVIIPVLAYFILTYLGRFSVPNAAAIAAHYGSVSVVTFAVVLEFLRVKNVGYENYMTVILVLMEIPAILVAIFIARIKMNAGQFSIGKLMHEVFLGKSVCLLLGGMIIGFIADPSKIDSIKMVFLDPFKGVLVLFLLDMGLVVSQRLPYLRSVGIFLIGFSILMPIVSAVLGAFVGKWLGLSFGGTVILATLSASASYIAAPAAVRIAIPEANPTLYLTSALAITFPFNITLGIPLYYQMVSWIYG